jgi:RNA polymerase sigma factor (sigma-70 family)
LNRPLLRHDYLLRWTYRTGARAVPIAAASPDDENASPDGQAVYQQLLVVRCQLGDRHALDELVRQWQPRLLYYIRRLLAADQDVQQVMQEVWLKVLHRVGSLRDPQRIAPWLYSLARYTAIDHLRDSASRRQLLSPLPADPVDGQWDATQAQFDDAEQVHCALSRLSLVDCEVLTLYFLDDLSVSGVSEVLNIPPGTVKSRLFHARRALAAALDRQQGA